MDIRDGHTTHLTTADQWGNVVSLTQTIGQIWFKSNHKRTVFYTQLH